MALLGLHCCTQALSYRELGLLFVVEFGLLIWWLLSLRSTGSGAGAQWLWLVGFVGL